MLIFLFFFGFAILQTSEQTEEEIEYSDSNENSYRNQLDYDDPEMLEYMHFKENYYVEYNDPDSVWDDKGNPVCGPNTYMENGHCFCKPEFQYGRPQTKEGCYSCAEECSAFGLCNYPGVCQCISYYEGDGLNCSMIVPSITGASKQNSNEVEIYISYYGDAPLTTGFCKFDDKIVNAKFVDRVHMLCKSPISLRHSVSLQISKNGINWSDKFDFDPKVSQEHFPSSRYKLLIIFIIAMVLLTLALSHARPVASEENQPFIKERPRKARRREFV